MERVTGIGGVFFRARDAANLRADDLDAMLAQLRRAGATVDERIEDGPDGRFGWAADPRETGSSSGNRPRGGDPS